MWIRSWIVLLDCLWITALGMPDAESWLHSSLHLQVLGGWSGSLGSGELFCLILWLVFSVSLGASSLPIFHPKFMIACFNAAIIGMSLHSRASPWSTTISITTNRERWSQCLSQFHLVLQWDNIWGRLPKLMGLVRHSSQAEIGTLIGLCLCIVWIQAAFVIAVESLFKNLMVINRGSSLFNPSTQPNIILSLLSSGEHWFRI